MGLKCKSVKGFERASRVARALGFLGFSASRVSRVCTGLGL